MKRTIAVIALVLIVGCNQSPPGGPGATGKPPVVGTAENTFKLDGPATETSIKQGETKTVTLGISRGKSFDQDVNLTVVDPAPKGITVTVVNNAIRAADKDTTMTIEAAKDAPVGHHLIKIQGAPAREGSKTTVDVKIEVKAAG